MEDAGDTSVAALRGLVGACGRALARTRDGDLPYPVDGSLVAHITDLRDRALADLAVRVAGIGAVFRDANDEIARAAREIGVDPAPFLCECSTIRCTTIIALTLADYDEVRSDGRQFLNAPEHDYGASPSVNVLADLGRYVLVEYPDAVRDIQTSQGETVPARP